MAKLIVYLRFSTAHQNEDQQELKINNYLNAHGLKADERVVECASGGTSYEERKLKRLLDTAERGDTIIVSEFSRLSRSMSNFSLMLNKELKPKGLNIIIVSLGMNIRCDEMKAIDELMLSFWGFAAQAEKELINERTLSGVAVAKANGSKFGRASEKYYLSDEDKVEAAKRMSLTKCSNNLNDPKTICLMKHFKRVVPALEEASTDEHLFFLNWSVETARIVRENIIQITRNINEFSRDLFPKGITEAEVKQAYYNKLGSIKKYNELNK